MSKKIRVRRTKPAGIAPAVAKPAAKVIEPEPEQEVEVNVDDDYRMWNIADLQAELQVRGLPADGRKSAMVARLDADDAGESAEGPEEEAADDTDDNASEEGVVAGSLSDLFDALNDGTSVTITKLGKDKWQFVTGGVAAAATVAPVSAPKGRGLTGMAFEKEAYSQEFFKWYYEDAGSGKPWNEMTSEERYALAEEIGASWEEHDEPRVDAMRMGQAVREKLDIAKWKPEYDSRASRKALKAG